MKGFGIIIGFILETIAFTVAAAAEETWTLERFLNDKPDVKEVLYASSLKSEPGVTNYVWGFKSGSNACLVRGLTRPISLEDPVLKSGETLFAKVEGGHNYFLFFRDTNSVLWDQETMPDFVSMISRPFGLLRAEREWSDGALHCVHSDRIGHGGRWETATEDIVDATRQKTFHAEYQFDYTETVLRGIPKRAYRTCKLDGTNIVMNLEIVRISLGKSSAKMFDVNRFLPPGNNFSVQRQIGDKVYKKSVIGSWVLHSSPPVGETEVPPFEKPGTRLFYCVALLGLCAFVFIYTISQHKQSKRKRLV